MYHCFREVWHGFAKNATEGMATPIGLPIWTVLLLGGHVAPWVLLVGHAAGMLSLAGSGMVGGLVAAGAAFTFSLIVGVWQRQHWLSIFGRPLGVILLVAIQWQALVWRLLRRPAIWKGRA
jgi:hypothetical protein